MNIEEARKIWNMREDELIEWVEMVNQRERDYDDEEDEGETIEVLLVSHSSK